MPYGIGTGGGSVRRKQHHAIRMSAYCRRLNIQEAREYARETRHTQSWWRWYFSPRQVAKRRRARAKALRREQAYVRREKAYLAKHGLRWVSYPKCPAIAKARHQAAERKKRDELAAARRRRAAACRRALGPYPASKAARAAKASRAAKPSKATRARKVKC
jgi:hypothetical protein